MPELLHPHVAEFVSNLEEILEILDEYSPDLWAAKIRRVKAIAAKSDGYAIDLFLSYFGGMGSLNDLVLNASANVNSSLHDKLKQAAELARTLK